MNVCFCGVIPLPPQKKTNTYLRYIRVSFYSGAINQCLPRLPLVQSGRVSTIFTLMQEGPVSTFCLCCKPDLCLPF